MRTPHLARIGYVSALCEHPASAELDVLLSAWRRRNAEHGITGLLLHDAGAVFQLIEGFPEDVVRLYEAIARDRRHRFIARLIHEAATERSFGDWSMAMSPVTGRDLAIVPALRAFADPEFRYCHCDEGMAEALVAAFTTGPWRRSIG
jgi:FAD-dependent sensor of blue light